METFDNLGIEPELIEALASEGIEVPTALQRDALPVLGRGNSAVLRGGPGAGSLLAYGLPLLARTEPGAGAPQAVVLVPEREQAHQLASSLARLGAMTGHRVAALGGTAWALPTHSDLLFATPAELLGSVRSADVKLDQVASLVIDGASLLEGENLLIIEALLEAIPEEEAQRVVVAEPISDPVRSFVDERMRKAVFLPPEAAATQSSSSPVQRGALRLRTIEGAKDERVVEVVSELLEEGISHLLLFFRSEDRAADLGDLLALHGFPVGVPGDPSVPVWLGGDPMEARRAIADAEIASDSFLAVSVDVPSDLDVLDRRHGIGGAGGVVLTFAREIPHFRRIAGAAGYSIAHFPSASGKPSDAITLFRAQVSNAVETEDLTGYLLLLEPLFDRHGSAQVAAALAALLRRKTPAAKAESGAPESRELPDRATPPAPFVRLFLSVGSKDGVGPGDLVGAITGESGVEGSKIGRIEIRDTFARVEVQEAVAPQVVKALNGTTIKGRSVRVDYDRGERHPDEARGPRGGKGRPSGGSRPPSGRGGRPR